jgi:hypothetical protein
LRAKAFVSLPAMNDLGPGIEICEGTGSTVSITADQMDFSMGQTEALPDWAWQLKLEKSSCDEAGYLPIRRV